MIDGKFDWPLQGDIIRIRNGVIVSGHHRLIAARLAAQATGRPLFAGPNAIIPKGAIAFESGGNLDGVGKAWGRIGVDPGTKPSTSIGYGDDPEHQALKEMLGSDD